jgi:hypothetical protein
MDCRDCRTKKEMPRHRAVRHTEKRKFLEMVPEVWADKEMGPREKKKKIDQIIFHALDCCGDSVEDQEEVKAIQKKHTP